MQIETVETSSPTPICLTKTFEASIRAFNDNGVETTSLTQISKATGIPSERLARAFHDTENLFSSVVKWYLVRYEHLILSSFVLHSNPIEAIRFALYECVELFCEDDCPHGSLLSVELMKISDRNGVIAQEMTRLKEHAQARIFQKLDSCKQRFSANFDPDELSGFYTDVMVILVKQACEGVSRNHLYDLADASLEKLESDPVLN